MTVFGSITTNISRRYMSITYGEYNQSLSPRGFIVFPGQLVEIRRNCFEQTGVYGIIIECMCPHFGIGYDDDYWVYISGELTRVKNFQIHPVNLH